MLLAMFVIIRKRLHNSNQWSVVRGQWSEIKSVIKRKIITFHCTMPKIQGGLFYVIG